MSRFFSGALVVALLLPSGASAQMPGARVTASAGMDAVLYDGSTYVPGYVGQLGLEWRPTTSRGALRMGMMHFQRNRASTFDCETGLECTETRRYGVTGLRADGTFELTRGRFRPYVSSGVGLYRSVTTGRTTYRCTGACFDIARPSYATSMGVWTGGLHSGVGLSADLSRTTVFTEFGVLLLATDGRQARGMLPLTLGVKF